MTPSNYDPFQADEVALDGATLDQAVPPEATPGKPESGEGTPGKEAPGEEAPGEGTPGGATSGEATSAEATSAEATSAEGSDAPQQADPASQGEELRGEPGTQGKATTTRPAQARGPLRSGPRQRTPPGAPRDQRPDASRAAATGLTRLRVPQQGPSSRYGRREPLPSQRDHAEYSRMPAPEPTASRVVPMLLLGVGLGGALYLSLVVHHYPMAIFVVLISLVAAPLARMIFQGSIQ